MQPIGLYIHVPFCKSKCGYCDFYSVKDDSLRKSYAPAVCRELQSRWKNGELSTVYFGGGTPSQLTAEDYTLIFDTICKTTGCNFDGMEITLEANPDDLSEKYLASLTGLPFNRISIGIQSFNDKELAFINRRHNARQAIEAVGRCQQYGFQNISIDLMYGLPLQTMTTWEYSIEKALELHVEHISAYMLSLEENVPLFRSLQKGDWEEANDETASTMYKTLSERLTAAGYEHYEISNFSLPGFRSLHNSSYWKSIPYIGIGPGAHSYDAVLQCRSWNVPDVKRYISFFGDDKYSHSRQSKKICGMETLSETDLYNEFIMTRLRTLDGLDTDELQSRFRPELVAHFLQTIKNSPAEWFVRDGHQIHINPASWFISDEIIRELICLG